jgi:hypothetical protein
MILFFIKPALRVLSELLLPFDADPVPYELSPGLLDLGFDI